MEWRKAGGVMYVEKHCWDIASADRGRSAQKVPSALTLKVVWVIKLMGLNRHPARDFVAL